MYKKAKIFCSKTFFLLVYALVISVAYNFIFWSNLIHLAGLGIHGLKILTATFCVVYMVYYIFFSIFSFNNWLLKISLTFFTILSAGAAYFIKTYNVFIDSTMIQNLFATDVSEASDLLSLTFFAYLIVLGVIPAVLIWLTEFKKESILRSILKPLITGLILLAISIILFFGFAKEIFTFYRPHKIVFDQQVPYSLIVSTIKYAKKTFSKPIILKDLDYHETYVSHKKPRAVVLVIGETARRQNFSLYGYEKDTNPNLKKQSLFVLNNTTSCGTSTAASLPCIFDARGSENHRKYGKNVLPFTSLFSKLKINQIWLDNNFGGCYNNCKTMEFDYTSHLNDPKFCRNGDCVDGIMLDKFANHIAKNKVNDLFLVVHQNGSHGPKYHERYPAEFAKFTPECRTNQVEECSPEEIINTYDNTILYTDKNLSDMINVLKQHKDMDTVLIYISDHGESLGESGMFLHGAPYAFAPKEQTSIPFLIWMSDGIKKSINLNTACLNNKLNEQHGHDNIFSTVSNLFGVRTSYYKPELDVLNKCTDN